MLAPVVCTCSSFILRSRRTVSLDAVLKALHSTQNVGRTARKSKPRLERQQKYEDILTNEVLYGRSVCNIALKASRRAMFRLHLLALWEDTSPTDARVLEAISLASERGLPVSYHSRSRLDRMSLQRPHQGICLEVGELPFLKLEDNMESQTASTSSPPLWVLLHGLLDPMNVGAVLRSCFYFGVDGVIVHGSCAPVTPIVSKASSGAAEILPIYRTEDAESLTKSLLKRDWNIIGTSCDTSGRDPCVRRVQDTHKTNFNKTLLIFGSEGSGIPENLLETCSDIVSIEPPGVENSNHSLRHLVGNLNVSTAAGIILYELKARR